MLIKLYYSAQYHSQRQRLSTIPASAALLRPSRQAIERPGSLRMTLPHDLEAAVAAAGKPYPKPATYHPAYGTAGFRDDASKLASTVFRCGLLVAARVLNTGGSCGVMITASHNVDSDNGVKLVDPSGEMLDPAWEEYATTLAQAQDDAALAAALQDILAANPPGAGGCSSHGNSNGVSNGVSNGAAPAANGNGTPAAGHHHHAKVIVGRDTRTSGPDLVAACLAGVGALGVHALDIGVVTTPELHFAVQIYNAYGTVQEEAYFTNLEESFRSLIAGTEPVAEPMYVDCANGVGAIKLLQMAPKLAELGLKLELRNKGDGRLNHLCGADYVQKEQVLPAGFDDVPEGARCCSIDGDADRIVFFTKRSGKFVLLDGDKISALAAIFLNKILTALPTDLNSGINTGVVQSAYANGASTDYITKTLNLTAACTPTGVKHLHHEAKAFDIGIYFESNGHGTVLFKPEMLSRLAARLEDQLPVVQLLAVSRLMNQCVGDAISGLLLVESVFRSGTSLSDWESIYADLPSRQTKLKVADRSAITTTDAERVCVTPEGLQAAIEAAAKAVDRGRAFVRPSGTEDAVRVYAEASTQDAADELAVTVARLVYDRAGGVGPKP